MNIFIITRKKKGLNLKDWAFNESYNEITQLFTLNLVINPNKTMQVEATRRKRAKENILRSTEMREFPQPNPTFSLSVLSLSSLLISLYELPPHSLFLSASLVFFSFPFCSLTNYQRKPIFLLSKDTLWVLLSIYFSFCLLHEILAGEKKDGKVYEKSQGKM